MSISLNRLSFSLGVGLAVLLASVIWGGNQFPPATFPGLIVANVVMRDGPDGTSQPELWFKVFLSATVAFWTGAAYLIASVLLRGLRSIRSN